jgi:hypothetical protein
MKIKTGTNLKLLKSDRILVSKGRRCLVMVCSCEQSEGNFYCNPAQPSNTLYYINISVI